MRVALWKDCCVLLLFCLSVKGSSIETGRRFGCRKYYMVSPGGICIVFEGALSESG